MTWNYSNTAVQTTLSGTINAVTTSITVASVSGFPVSYPYTLVIDYGASNAEVVNVTAGVGTTLTVTRGQDGTSAGGHSSGVAVVHALVARDAAEPQSHIAASTAVHGLAGGVAVVGTTTSQTLTNKTIDGGANTLSNINTSSLVGTIAASSVTGNFSTVAVAPNGSTVGLDVGASASRTAHLLDVRNSFNGTGFIVGDDGVVTVDDTDLVVDTRRAPAAAATTSRIYSKNGTSKPALVLDRATANTDNLMELKANGSTIGTVDKDAKLSTRGILTNQIAADTTTLLYEAKNSGGSSMFSVNYQGNVAAAGNATVSGTLGVTGNTTLTGTLTANGVSVTSPPIARVRATGAQSIPNITTTAITFDVEDVDNAAGHSTVTNTSRYTAPYTGYYLCSGNVTFAANATGSRLAFWMKNGSIIDGAGVNGVGHASIANEMALPSTIVQLNATQYVEIGVFQNSGGSLNTSVSTHEMPTMSVVYLGA